MKRVYLAIVLLTVVLIGCIVTIRAETVRLKELITLTEKMEACCREGDREQTLRLAQDLATQFPQKTRCFSLFLNHSVLTEIEECVIALPIHLESGNTEESLVEISRCRLLLQKQLEQELPTWENIL